MKPHSLACSSPPSVEVWFLIDQEMVLVMTHCAGIVDSCSKPNSGTFCKTNHPASSLFLKKQMALKLEEEQLFSLKGEQPSETYDYILLINCEKTSPFWNQGNLYVDWILDVNFIGNKRAFFFLHPIILPQTLIMHILWNVHFIPQTLKEKWIRSKRENEMRICLDLKTDLHSSYVLNCVHPWLPMWWY